MSDINWEQLFRNGQLIQSEPEHKEMLDRYFQFYKGTPEESLFASMYPNYALIITVKIEPEELVTLKPESTVVKVSQKRKKKAL